MIYPQQGQLFKLRSARAAGLEGHSCYKLALDNLASVLDTAEGVVCADVAQNRPVRQRRNTLSCNHAQAGSDSKTCQQAKADHQHNTVRLQQDVVALAFPDRVSSMEADIASLHSSAETGRFALI